MYCMYVCMYVYMWLVLLYVRGDTCATERVHAWVSIGGMYWTDRGTEMTDVQEGREGRDHCFPLSQSLTVLLLRQCHL